MCLLCDERGRQFETLEAVRRHMVDKNHCKLRWGDGSGVAEEELEEFYDYSPRFVFTHGGRFGLKVLLCKTYFLINNCDTIYQI